MTWFWTDDLARVALDRGIAGRESVQTWIDRPIAISAPEGTDPAAVIAQELGLPAGEEGAA